MGVFGKLAWLLSGMLVAAQPARAQCFADEPIAGWEAGDLFLPQPGASRPEPGGDGDDLQLCSQGGGFAPGGEGFRYLVRRRGGDFEIVARLESVIAIGEAGLIARSDVRDPASPLIRIAVEVEPRVMLFSELRNSDAEPAAAVGNPPVPVTLPLWLRVRRSGSVLSTAFSTDGSSWTTHATHDASDGELAEAQLAVGMFQTSRDDLNTAVATFGDVAFAPVPLPPDAGCIDDILLPTSGGARVEIAGIGLERVSAVTIGGQRAVVVSATPTLLAFDTPALAAGASALASGRIVLAGDFAPHELETPIAFGGVPFLRGDCDGDLDVDAADLGVLQDTLGRGGRELQCEASADLDGDLLVTWSDHARLADWLARGLVPPPAPFPVPGVPSDGGLLCGQPANPRLAEVLDGAGAPLVPGARTRAGDELRITGADLPPAPERSIVHFGDVRTTVLGDSTASELHVRVERVPTSGVKCPVVFEDLAIDPPVVDPAEGAPSTEQRFGIAWAIAGETARAGLCPDFEAIGPAPIATSSWDVLAERTVLAFDTAQWNPAHTYQLNLRLYSPHTDSGSRGSRIVSFSFNGSGAPSLRQWLPALAQRITAELGNPEDDCDCDFRAVSLWPVPAIGIDPCEPTGPGDIAQSSPGPGPDPPYEPELFLKAPPGPLSTADAFAPFTPECGDDGFSPDDQPRLWSWCEFEKIVRPHANGSGLPTWEFYIPDHAVMGAPNAINELAPPQDRTPAEKSIEFSANAYQHARNEIYHQGCGPAARLAHCVGGNADWMPAFPPDARVIKTFWRSHGGLPFSADPDDFYSYDPTGPTPRQYLVGMHVVVGTFDVFDPWQWSTFWVPRGGDTFDKNGNPLDYDLDCSVGSSADQPQELTGVWTNFAMCNQEQSGGSLCGNPWAHGECSGSCASCHGVVGSVDFEGGNNQLPLSFSWMPSLIPSGVQDCLDYINDNPGAYDSLVPEACQ